ncbi:MAG TPA: serine/threonine protein kinase, partial [Microbacterium sp.]|nr:serine/threonine protein kinase [Microbacterium sp.]
MREIERELGVTPQVARTVDTGVTRDESGASGELTKVLPAAVTGPTDLAEDVDNTSRLRQASKRRSRKGAWLLGVVVILTALAGAAGWWFGSGPGSQVAVPDLSGLTFDQAQGALAEESLTGVEEGVFSLEVDSGLIVDTEPEAGARVDKDTEVTVLVSLGPAEVALTGLNGQPETDVRAQLDASRIDVGENQTFYTDADEGVVVGVVVTPRGGADPVECGEECTVNEGDSASLRVSLGPLPSVRDMTEADARATLEAA